MIKKDPTRSNSPSRYEIIQCIRKEMAGDSVEEKFQKIIERFPEVLKEPKKGGETFLMSIAMAGWADLLKKFIPFINPKAKTHSGNTALIFAAGSAAAPADLVEVIKVLLPVSEPLVKNGAGYSAYLSAARSGNLELLKLLYSPEAHQQKDLLQRNALMIAVTHNNRSCVEWLIPYSDPEKTDHYGFTASMLAEHDERFELVGLLKEWEHAAAEKKTLQKEIQSIKTTKAKKVRRASL